jgi:hypothetical protein
MIETHVLSYTRYPTPGKAAQQIFIRTGFFMWPRLGLKVYSSPVWLYDLLIKDASKSSDKPTSVLTEQESIAIMHLCESCAYHPDLWHIIYVYLRHLPDQERFYRVTFTQPFSMAWSFYNLTIKKQQRN